MMHFHPLENEGMINWVRFVVKVEIWECSRVRCAFWKVEEL